MAARSVMSSLAFSACELDAQSCPCVCVCVLLNNRATKKGSEREIKEGRYKNEGKPHKCSDAGQQGEQEHLSSISR